MKKIIFSLFLVFIVSIFAEQVFSQFSIEEAAKTQVVKMRRCSNNDSTGVSFPFWRRQCEDCRVHFVSAGGDSYSCYR